MHKNTAMKELQRLLQYVQLSSHCIAVSFYSLGNKGKEVLAADCLVAASDTDQYHHK